MRGGIEEGGRRRLVATAWYQARVQEVRAAVERRYEPRLRRAGGLRRGLLRLRRWLAVEWALYSLAQRSLHTRP